MSSTEQLLNLAFEHHRAERLAEAQVLYEQVLRGDPRNVDALQLLGTLAHQQGLHEQAVELISRAIQSGPVTAPVYCNLGAALRSLERYQDAVRACEQAIRLHPDYAEAHNDLGAGYQELGNLRAALACYDRALALGPRSANAHYNRGRTFLTLGQFDEGWAEYEWRWQRSEFVRPPLDKPEWDGSPLAGRTLLVRAEQGLGDTLQFIRYLPLLERLGRVTCEVQPQLVPLLTQSGVKNLIAQGEGLPEFDLHLSLLSLPSRLRTRLETIPQSVPYLAADRRLVSVWQEKLAASPGFKIGVHWQSPKNSPVRGRSFRLSSLESIAKIAGARLISLQKGEGREQISALQGGFEVIDFSELDEQHGPFMDSAAIMSVLDLVITCDSATAHLAGGLGAPVWVALPKNADWRWLLDRADSPWYPTMRLFRQPRAGDWASVFASIAAEVRKCIAAVGR